ncbi:MAG: alpha/beta fold hydrolase [Crocinitomicaceae bacterium]
MIDFKNKIYVGSDHRKSLYDAKIDKTSKAVVIFIHGYKGFKDWGAWNLMADAFFQEGFGFVKFNMTHNGGTIDEPIDFPDLKAFARNRYSYELFDVATIIDETQRLIEKELELDIPIYLLGHSRGGGIAILQAVKDSRIKKVVSLAGISDIESRFPMGEQMKEWKEKGVYYVTNSRTHQEMPHYFSWYEDFLEHRNELDIELAARELKIPFLQIHGDMDQSVSISEGLALAAYTDTRIAIIKGAEHTFGTKHPWDSDQLPEDLKKAINKAIEFFNK